MPGDPDRSRPGSRPTAGTAAFALALLLSACIGYDPDHGDLVLDNRSDQPVHVYIAGYDGEESLLAGPIEPGDNEVFSVLPRGRKCPDAGVYVLRDEAGRELARRDNTVDPVCDGEPWVWTAESD